jgi:hypothetical protein
LASIKIQKSSIINHQSSIINHQSSIINQKSHFFLFHHQQHSEPLHRVFHGECQCGAAPAVDRQLHRRPRAVPGASARTWRVGNVPPAPWLIRIDACVLDSLPAPGGNHERI